MNEPFQHLQVYITTFQWEDEDLKEAIGFIHKNKETGDEQFKSKAWTHIALAIQSLEYNS
jgi:hypothetical protein